MKRAILISVFAALALFGGGDAFAQNAERFGGVGLPVGDCRTFGEHFVSPQRKSDAGFSTPIRSQVTGFHW